MPPVFLHRSISILTPVNDPSSSFLAVFGIRTHTDRMNDEDDEAAGGARGLIVERERALARRVRAKRCADVSQIL